jgi:DNA-binding transcriptional LysR family regulator
VRLLQRTTRRLRLTDIGQGYYERCKQIVEAYDEANREASNRSATSPLCSARRTSLRI